MAEHKTLAAALAAFQAELPTVEKGNTARVATKSGPGYTYEYADLSDISPKVLPLLGKHGLSWKTKPTVIDGNFVLHYALMHELGEADEGIYPLPPASTAAQTLGGAITYARRYALCAVTGVAPGGDDHDMQPAGAPNPPAAQEPTAPAGWEEQVDSLASKDDANAFWKRAAQGGWLTEEVQARVSERVAALHQEPQE